ncbi:MAG TPA: Eco57I restriction-modification methylase domain-containing protein [Candidatus Anammoximicrobium sp.]|nr:Eco57I restriction-modification methylase domain-containing protein [Candidatus Anammoximicrobium sp.]
MPVEAKPLFRPDVIRSHLAAFSLPARVEPLRRQLADWASLLATGRANNFKEQELLPDFLTLYFHGVLGYTGPADNPDRYSISREHHVQVDGKFADAVLGEFNGTPRYVAALEGKGPKDPLDRPFAGRRMSAVDQGYRYAINLPCDWVIVTSIHQIRLYYKGCDQHTYELFDTERLADDENHLRRFVFLLGAERVVPADGTCHLATLLGESDRVGRDLTKEFYLRYADMRQDAFEQLCRDNPDVSRHEVLSATQKLLDRVLFCAFCEDRGLLPVDTIRKAYEHRDPYHPRPIWENFHGLFQSINRGNAALGIHAYNGGLFADDPLLDALQVADAVCGYFRDLGAYDYRPAAQAASSGTGASLIDVDILGHIFEQSITDLERLRNELDGLAEPVGADKHKTRRKKEGAFYTPAFITRYIIEQALGGVLRDRFEQLRQRHEQDAKGTARTALADPGVYELDKLNKPQQTALVQFWEAWQDELAGIRLLDPACGSGAFLIEAFDQLHAAYQASNDRLQELRGHRSLFDLDRRILEHNLYGVDLNDEAIEICRLSLWIKTAQRGKTLASLDHPIRVGNSVVADPAVHPKAFDWQAAFPEVFKAGGFDVVVGNPPYVRQELLSPIKPYLQSAYRAYHGMADLYVYFYELGLRVLKPGGLLSFVVTNKWMKAGYGEPLRQFFAEQAWIESVVDFGHAKQIFLEADVFPSIIVARRPTGRPKPRTARLCAIPRDQLRVDDLSRQIENEGVELPLAQLGCESWNLEPSGVTSLLAKIRQSGVPLTEFAKVEPFRGILTGFNEAFLIDSITRDRLISLDPNCRPLIRRNLRGQDFSRWVSDWNGYWLICVPSSENAVWPWSEAGDHAEAVFSNAYPSLFEHFRPYQDALVRRQDKGRFWWELRSCAYWPEFDKPKIMYPEITWRASWGLDVGATVCNNTAYFIASVDTWVLAAANSPAMWWFSWRTAVHGKDEALRFIKDFVRGLPIPPATDDQRKGAAENVRRIIEITASQQAARRTILDWLRVEYEIAKPTLKLQSPIDLDSDGFVGEVKKVRGKKKPLTAAGLKALRDEYARSLEPARKLAAEAVKLEHELSDLVNAAYGLTPDEIALMWKTAPPRMPIAASLAIAGPLS